jgi:hypothetical protein
VSSVSARCPSTSASSPISVNIVVERDLLPLENIPLREDAHPQSAADDPFLHLAVRVARVIGESSDPALLRCVDVLSSVLQEDLKLAHLLLLQHHEVEMPYPLVRVLLHPFPESRLLDHLADVFVDQISAAGSIA